VEEDGGLAAWAERSVRRRPGALARGCLRFAFYGRVSTEDWQDPASSLARQREQAGALGRGHGRIVAEFFDAGESRHPPADRAGPGPSDLRADCPDPRALAGSNVVSTDAVAVEGVAPHVTFVHGAGASPAFPIVVWQPHASSPSGPAWRRVPTDAGSALVSCAGGPPRREWPGRIQALSWSPRPSGRQPWRSPWGCRLTFRPRWIERFAADWLLLPVSWIMQAHMLAVLNRNIERQAHAQLHTGTICQDDPAQCEELSGSA
jgi:hypothetical protein